MRPTLQSRPAVIGAGAASLFVELTLIRYVPGEVRVLGYFTNFVLFAAFLGLGIGILAARRFPRARALSWVAPIAFLGVVAGTLAGDLLHVAPSADEFLFLEYQTARAQVSLYGFLLGAFVMLAAGLVPLGHVVGRTLDGDQPLARYASNLIGSLVGIALFTAMSALGAPPFAWVLVSGAFCGLGLLDAPNGVRVAGALAIVGAGIVAWTATSDARWSPYQKISTAPLLVHPEQGVITEWRLTSLSPADRARLRPIPEREGFVIRVNEDSYQFPTALSDTAVARRPGLRALRMQYDTAFSVRRRAGRVLVMGAGSGNDVAAALRAGATHVDAVEIDPVILALGARHPERPYEDRRVRAIVDDGRAWLARTSDRYDTIVFALIDSHVLASQKSTVRLDSFVFTRESFALARARLAPRGVMVVSHAVGEPWFVHRMLATLDAAFGRPPFLLSAVREHPLGIAYAAGESVPSGPPIERGVEPLTDDWPFLYLRARTIPVDYLVAIVLVLTVAVIALAGVAGKSSRSIRPAFVALGAGFLLLETRGLSVLGVLAGNTWQSVSSVFSGVLVMALVATLVSARVPDRHALRVQRVAFVLLLVALAVTWAVPVASVAALPRELAILVAGGFVALPMLASGVVYALELRREGNADAALASNLVGALAGGLAEYASMVVGLRALLVLAAAVYVLAWVFSARALRAAASR